MTVARLTQAFVDHLARSPPPARDAFHWCAKGGGFGVKHATTGRVSWVLQWRDRTTGRSHRLALGSTGLLRLDAARKAAEAHAGRIAAGGNPLAERRAHKASLSFAELVTRYLASDAWTRKAPSTQAGDSRRISLYLLPALGSRKLVEITLADLKALTTALADPAKADALARRGGATKNTPRGGEGGARRTMRLCKALFSFAHDAELIADNPAARLKLGSDGARELAPNDQDYSRLWQALDRHRGNSPTMGKACDVFALLALTGARRGEIRSLRWRHVDLDGCRIVLPKGEHKAGRKTGKPRTISLPDEAVAILARYPAGRPEAFVFAGQNGSPVALQRPWRRIARAAGLATALVLHSLRHGVGSALAAAGMQPQQIAAQLGHAGWRTSERYVHRVDAAMVILAQRTAHLVKPPPPILIAA